MSNSRVGYQFTISGQYTAHGDHGKVPKFYKDLVFVLPEISTYRMGNKWEHYKVGKQDKKRSVPNIITQNTLRCYKHLLRKYHVTPELRHKHDDFVRVRTLQVLKKERIELTDEHVFLDINKAAIGDMKEGDLIMYCAMKDIMVDLSPYVDLADKRMAVEMAWSEQNDKVEAVEEKVAFDPNLAEPEGVMISQGAISTIEGVPEDGVPLDEESTLSQFE